MKDYIEILSNDKNKESDSLKTFRELCDKMCDVYEKKNNDYGSSAHKTFDEFGHISFIVRISDKFNRYKSLTIGHKNNCVEDEKIEDTLLDMASYCLMAVIETKTESNKQEIVYEIDE